MGDPGQYRRKSEMELRVEDALSRPPREPSPAFRDAHLSQDTKVVDSLPHSHDVIFAVPLQVDVGQQPGVRMIRC